MEHERKNEMEKTVKVNGKEYYVNTNPSDKWQFWAEVAGVSYREASGVIADAMTELTGKRPQIADKVYLDDDERYEVVLALGRGFSRSKKWQDTYELAMIDWRHKNLIAWK
jgi:hypothetical protein